MAKSEKQHLKVLRVMLSGKPISREEFEADLGNSVYLYRLSTYMWKIRKMGGKVEANRDGKEVTSYKLLNHEEMAAKLRQLDADAFAAAAKPKAAKPKAAKPKAAKPKAAKPKAAKPKAAKPKAAKPKVSVAKVRPAVTVKPEPLAKAVGDDLPEVMPISSASVDADFDAFSADDLPSFLK